MAQDETAVTCKHASDSVLSNSSLMVDFVLEGHLGLLVVLKLQEGLTLMIISRPLRVLLWAVCSLYSGVLE